MQCRWKKEGEKVVHREKSITIKIIFKENAVQSSFEALHKCFHEIIYITLGTTYFKELWLLTVIFFCVLEAICKWRSTCLSTNLWSLSGFPLFYFPSFSRRPLVGLCPRHRGHPAIPRHSGRHRGQHFPGGPHHCDCGACARLFGARSQ